MRFFRGDSILGDGFGEGEEEGGDSLAEYCRSQRAKYEGSNQDINIDLDSVVESMVAKQNSEEEQWKSSNHNSNLSSSKPGEEIHQKSDDTFLDGKIHNSQGMSQNFNQLNSLSNKSSSTSVPINEQNQISSVKKNEMQSKLLEDLLLQEEQHQFQVEALLSDSTDDEQQQRRISLDEVLDSLLALPSSPRSSSPASSSPSLNNILTSTPKEPRCPPPVPQRKDLRAVTNSAIETVKPKSPRETIEEMKARLTEEISDSMSREDLSARLTPRESMSEITTRISQEVSKMLPNQLSMELNKELSSKLSSKFLKDIPDENEMNVERNLLLKEYQEKKPLENKSAKSLLLKEAGSSSATEGGVNKEPKAEVPQSKVPESLMSELSNVLAKRGSSPAKSSVAPPKPARGGLAKDPSKREDKNASPVSEDSYSSEENKVTKKLHSSGKLGQKEPSSVKSTTENSVNEINKEMQKKEEPLRQEKRRESKSSLTDSRTSRISSKESLKLEKEKSDQLQQSGPTAESSAIEPFACFPSEDQRREGGTYRLRYSYDPNTARSRPRPKQSQENLKVQALQKQQQQIEQKKRQMLQQQKQIDLTPELGEQSQPLKLTEKRNKVPLSGE